MIRLTKLRGETLWLNPELIEVVEAVPDTLVRLINGREYIVAETPEEIQARYMDYRTEVSGGRWVGGVRIGAAIHRGIGSPDGELEGDG